MHEVRPVSITTATLYSQSAADQVRLRLALQSAQSAISNNFEYVVVDGGSDDEFISQLITTGATVYRQNSPGMAQARKEALEKASDTASTLVLTEPEKVSFVRDCLDIAMQPLILDKADIVIPRRNATAFATYPPFQAEIEQKANCLWNAMLKKHNLLPEGEQYDIWFGVRLFQNRPDIKKLFMRSYNFNRHPEIAVHELLRTELWANVLYLPILAALKQGLRVISVDVPYIHPAEQTAVEIEKREYYLRKRVYQLKNIFMLSRRMMKYLNDDPTGSRLSITET